MKNLNKYSACMICSYIVSLIAVFLPFCGGEFMGEKIKISFFDFFSLEKKFGMDAVELGSTTEMMGMIKTMVVLLIVFSVIGIILFLADIGKKIKYGIAVLMALFGEFIYLALEMFFSYAKKLSAETVSAGIGLHLGMLGAVFQIIFPLVYLCILTDGKGSMETIDVVAPIKEVKEIITNNMAGGEGILAVLKGENAGMEIPMENGRKVILGRNAAECNLVVFGTKVSRKHCSVGYDAAKQMYCLTDYSSNGTYLINDARLEPLAAVWVKPGTRFYLGNKENVFELR